MSFWQKLSAGFKTAGKDVEKVALEAGKVALPVVEAAAPIAATTFLGPAGGQIVTAVMSEITTLAAKGKTPNTNLLKTSIGMLIEGAIGVLQATGKLPSSIESYVGPVEAVVGAVTGVTPPPGSTITASISSAPSAVGKPFLSTSLPLPLPKV